jgi:hypothetical protein|tara:strand:+ start:1332 stop:1454 length:123 start_codon:yes stop_codon:yes gene_type:complete
MKKENIMEIKIFLSAGVPQTVLAELFKTSKTAINRIARMK